MREVLALGAPPETLRRDAEALVLRAADAVGMAASLDRPVNQLSGGEQQRVHLARVLVQLWAHPSDGNARYLLLDEPTSHLDPAQQVLVARLARAHAAGGGGVLAVLHDLNLATAIADEVVVMRQGRIAARGAPRATLSTALLAEIYGIGFRAIEAGAETWLMPAPVA